MNGVLTTEHVTATISIVAFLQSSTNHVWVFRLMLNLTKFSQWYL